MKRSRVAILVWTVATWVMILAPPFAKADSGIVQLHETQGPFSVTVFLSPDLAREGLADVSILVQWKESAEVVLDADVNLGLDPPTGITTDRSEPLCTAPSAVAPFQLPGIKQHQVTVRATRDQASNKLLYAATVKLNAVGDWRLRVYVVHGSESAHFDCLIPVSSTAANPSGLWSYLILPPIVIAAFVLNQVLRRQSLETGSNSYAPSVGRT